MGKILVECATCQGQFEKKKSHYDQAVREGKNVYCSSKCLRESQTRLETRACMNCEADVSRVPSEFGERWFCSRSCAASFNNVGVTRNTASFAIACIGCGEKVSSRSKSGKCKKCVTDEYLSITVAELKERYANYQHPYRPVGDYIRAKARSMYGELDQCEHCGWKYNILIHHKDEIKDAMDEVTVGELNARERLLFLCGNCHNYLHSFGCLPNV